MAVPAERSPPGRRSTSAQRYVSRYQPPSTGSGRSPSAAISRSAVGRSAIALLRAGPEGGAQDGVAAPRHHLGLAEDVGDYPADLLRLLGDEVQPPARSQRRRPAV